MNPKTVEGSGLNRQTTPAAVGSPLHTMLGAYVGMRIVGGCDDCDAYQQVWPDPDRPEVWHITVHHDDDCLTYIEFLRHELALLRFEWDDNEHNPRRREEIKARYEEIKQQLAKGSR